MSIGKYTREDCLSLLCQKKRELEDAGLSRFPQRADFTDDAVVAIKAHLGPWPRALEAAGVKEAPTVDRKQKNKERRIRAKRARTAAMKQVRAEARKTEEKE